MGMSERYLREVCGVDLSGAKVSRPLSESLAALRGPAQAPPEPALALTPVVSPAMHAGLYATLVALHGPPVVRFTMAGRSVPWKVAIHRGGYATNPKFAAWKRSVSDAASVAMDRRPPWRGPFAFLAMFRIARFGSMPDLTNLTKGTLDALQGTAIINDDMSRWELCGYDPDAAESSADLALFAIT